MLTDPTQSGEEKSPNQTKKVEKSRRMQSFKDIYYDIKSNTITKPGGANTMRVTSIIAFHCQSWRTVTFSIHP